MGRLKKSKGLEVRLLMSTWKINLEQQTATSINGITFKLTENNGEYEGVCLNPKDIPPDDLDDVILGRMIKEAGIFYKMELERG
jgi:hypothetical protein